MSAPQLEFSSVTADAISQGIDKAIEKADQIVNEMVAIDGDRTFDNTMAPLDEVSDVLSHASARFSFMGYVHTDKAVRTAGKAGEEELGRFGVEMVFRDDLYQAIKDYAATDEAKQLEGEQSRFLEFTLRDLRHAGHELDPETRSEVKTKTQRLVELGTRFQQNIDESKDFILTTREDLEGLPDSYVDSLETDEETGKYKVTLDYPVLHPFIKNATRRDLRETMFFKNNTQAVAENRPILEEAIRLRYEIARAFGLNSWAEHRLEDRMAGSPKRVEELYAGLKAPLQDQGRKDLEAMSELLAQDTGDTVVQVWDWNYYDTQQQRSLGIDPFEVAEYFPLESVINALFDLSQEMFGLNFREVADPDVWHPDVRQFAVHDAKSDELLSHFYLDLHPREGKFGHAAEFPMILSRRLEAGSFQNPLCAMVANFTKPTPKAPSLLQHSEVETLFHEFGHVLHQNLGRTELTRFSGTNVERDFVEAPSQIMQHWVWRADMLARFARHYETGEPIPEQLVAKLVESRQLNISLHQLRQMQFGVWDQEIHGSREEKDLDQIVRKGAEVGLMPFQEDTFPLASFGHLMGGYDAAYYGYMWAEVFGDDMFSRFEAEGVTNPTVGMAYREEVLEKGGSLDADQMLRNFLGRDSENSAFLRKLGITGTT